ncbi:MAG: Gfo/Idh/MocA family oxidoreductase [Opitutaceae bacterium]
MNHPNFSLSQNSGNRLDRRTFVKTLAAAGLGLAVGTAPAAPAVSTEKRRRRFAQVGTGSRAIMHQRAVQETFRDQCEMVALCDLNPGRLELARRRSLGFGAAMPAGYLAADFDRMLRETRPEVVIVTTVDGTHADYIVRALEAGCDVITEKPMTTTAENCQRILDATARTGRRCRVAFNYRYSPARTQLKELLAGGAIGEVLSVDFHWMLDTHHGADYFRRWHSRKANSGGLMIHKATHHFDLVNWWLGALPESVWAVGKREFYTPATARRLGLASHHERCHTCPERAACAFALDLAASPKLRQLYLEQEQHDGYFRDRCVFRPEIDIEDTMNVIVRYETGTTISYSLNAFNSWEGYTIAFNGTKGRLEHADVESVYRAGAEPRQVERGPVGNTTRVIPLRGAAEVIEPRKGEGGHGGGDPLMLADLYLPEPPADPFHRASDEHGGAASCLIGAAANRSFVDGRPVRIADLVAGLRRPAGVPMPGRETAIPMPSACAWTP